MERSRFGGFVVVLFACSAQFMVVLDVSVVNVALPSVRNSLGFGPVGLEWVVNAYALVFAGFLLFGGRLADLYGKKRVFLTGLVLFTASSLVGGMASSPEALVLARSVQGFGAAILAPTTLTIITTTFSEGDRRNRALAAWTVIGLAGGTAGNVIGGALTDFLSWRWVFLVNVPVGIIVCLATVLFMEADRGSDRRGGLDVPGAVTVTVGVASLAYAVTRTNVTGFGDPVTILGFVIGIIALALFVIVESRLASDPLIPLSLLRMRSVSIGNVAMLLAGACLMPMWYFLTMTMQNIMGFGPLQTGLGFLPHTITTIVVGVAATPWLMRHIDYQVLIFVGSFIAAAGFLWQSLVVTQSSYLIGILGPAIIISMGSGLLNTPITAVVTSGVEESEAGAASGLMNTTKQLGGVLGLALLVALTASGVQTRNSLADDYALAFAIISATLVAVALVTLTLPRVRQTP